MKLESLASFFRWLDWRLDAPDSEPREETASIAPQPSPSGDWLSHYLFDRDSREDGVAG